MSGPFLCDTILTDYVILETLISLKKILFFFFFSEYIKNKILDAGFKVIENNYVSRKTVNIKENISVPRVYIQGKYQKSNR